MAVKSKSTIKSNKSKLDIKKKPRVVFSDIVKGLKDYGYSDEDIRIIQEAYDYIKPKGKVVAKQIRPIVPIEEWINSEYYIGPMVYNIYSFWKEHIINIFNGHNPRFPNEKVNINQVILTGALGTGKTSIGTLILIRKLYELSCYENVSSLYNLGPIARIGLAYLSVTKDQAALTGFAKIQEWLDTIPYFTQHFKRNDRIDAMLMWPEERVFVIPGSVANHFIGTDMIAGILDEANFFDNKPREESHTLSSKVTKIYTDMRNRGASRFLLNGKVEALSILVSSSTIASSFTEKQIKDHEDDPNTYIISPAQWDVTPEKFSAGRFPVFTGGNGIDAQIIKSVETYNILLSTMGFDTLPTDMTMETAYKALPNAIRESILLVPTDLMSYFRTDVVQALQDFAGYSSSASGKFFTNYSSYNDCLNRDYKHPFIKDVITLSTTQYATQEGYQPLISYIPRDYKFANTNLKRFVHLDLSKTGDATGIAMSHISGWKTIYERKEKDIDKFGKEYELVVEDIKRPLIKLDFMLKIQPPPKPEQISYGKIRDFLLALKKDYDISYEIITADQAFSAQLMQELSEVGINVGYLSVDRDSKAYSTLAELIYERRVELYDYEPFRTEFFGLVKYRVGNTIKIDHLPKMSKDVSDAVAGAVYNAITSKDKINSQEESNLFGLFVKANQKGDMLYNEMLEKLKKDLINKI